MGSKLIQARYLKGEAERLIFKKDYTGARGKILKAQEVFPDYENISGMLDVCHVLCAADMELPGCGINWYWVLQLIPSADDFDIISQYQKLTASVESIKGAFPGTDSAMKFIAEAFSILSDRAKRFAFDSKRTACTTGSLSCNSRPSKGNETTGLVENIIQENHSMRGSSMSKSVVIGEISDESNQSSSSSKLTSKVLIDLGERVGAADVSNENIQRAISSQLPAKWLTDLSKTIAANEASDEDKRRSKLGEVPSKRLRYTSGVNSVMVDVVDDDVKCVEPRTFPSVHDIGRREDLSQDQIWAVFDGSDAMPRQYVKVNNQLSASMVSVTHLEPHPMHDDEIRWVEENLPSVCGIFRLGTTTCIETSKFSQLVKCDHSTKKSFYRIYPREGEIWAMYRNWHKKWDLSNHNGCQCEVVEILQDFDEEVGMCVCRLIPVNNYLTFFQRQSCDGFQLTRSVSRTEMLRFSHRIPASPVLGSERHGIPKGSWHLEPDALPLNLC